ncbi:MAG: hypothetical protein NZ901_06790 [Geminocystis sp.]|nr:hypothetical protein [Geminocystis sp.]HIK38769.1 hypothetical protein [Geminocystis sp. M7585_C2015_104]MCS7147882.1 hypothetical protein [Geminocystis sp.]MCX8078708.1 hypothetical protein [Geminocystis sp.]MDW8117030.1 hypothetical protein [Geminocystis sp.]
MLRRGSGEDRCKDCQNAWGTVFFVENKKQKYGDSRKAIWRQRGKIRQGEGVGDNTEGLEKFRKRNEGKISRKNEAKRGTKWKNETGTKKEEKEKQEKGN